MKHKYLLYAIAALLALNLIGVFSAILKQNQASIDIAQLKAETEKRFTAFKTDLDRKADIDITDLNYEALNLAAANLQKNASGEIQRLHDRIDSAIGLTNERMAQLEKNLSTLRQARDTIQSVSKNLSPSKSFIQSVTTSGNNLKSEDIQSATSGTIKEVTPTLENTLEELIQKEHITDATGAVEIPK